MALLIIIYIGFISLGVPDSLIGAAWPAIYPEFGVSAGLVGMVTLIISACTVLSGFFSGKVLARFKTEIVTLVSTAMTAVAMLAFSFAPNIWVMCLSAIPLGLGAGAIDAGLNDYITLHYEAKHVNLLHCFYGVGVTCSPLLMSMALADNNQWRLGYRYAFILQAVITLVLFLSLPLWKKQTQRNGETEEEVVVRSLSFKEMLGNSELRITWALMFLINALECICGTWGSTFLAESKGVNVQTAASMISAFYIGITCGRFTSGVVSGKLYTWKRVNISFAFIATAILLLALPLPVVCSTIGFFLIGFGIGPVYPNLLFLTPHNFGKDISGSIMGTQIAFAYASCMITPLAFGGLQGWLGIGFYPVFLGTLCILTLVCLSVLTVKLKKNGKYNPNV